ncbi:MAG TPA: hypothetical protein DDZ51_15690 [Planctomycetaceae bacterium]|nr:hypothetical protein [Planctomycetaceae bacterium]
MIPDPFERTVRIPVQWIDGQWQLIGGGKLPELQPNVCADLSMPAIALANDEERARWTSGETVPFLATGTELFAQVNRNRVPGNLSDHALEKNYKLGHPSAFVPFNLISDVSLSFTPGKKAGLAGSKCRIPSLEIEVDSINEALTRISQAFEPNRKSFGGSVFLKVFIERNTRMIPLDDLRDQKASVAALDAARPRDRCDSWLELSVSLSRVSDIWNAHTQRRLTEASSNGFVTRPCIMRTPKASDKLLEQSASEYFDFRTKTMIYSDAGLIELMNRFHDPKETSEEIQKLRGLHEAMDRAVLNAYGWQDLALSARCEFLPPQGVKQPRFFRRSAQDERDIRLRWTDEFSQRVLDRLLAIADGAGELVDEAKG